MQPARRAMLMERNRQRPGPRSGARIDSTEARKIFLTVFFAEL
jgi:hypothetical protein